MFKARKTCQVEAQTLILLNRDIDMFLMQKCKKCGHFSITCLVLDQHLCFLFVSTISFMRMEEIEL